MEIPVYFFSGFLSGGKTTFIQNVLKDPSFVQGEKTLLIACEEGKTEYDKALLEKSNTQLVHIEDESELTEDFLKELEIFYVPERILIEFNGMWDMDSFLGDIVPENWFVVQIFNIINASTFQMYLKNMRSLVAGQIAFAQVVVFNRVEKTMKKAALRRSIKAVNRRTQVMFENADGSSSEQVEDDLPYNLSAKIIDVYDEDYGIWYLDMMEHPDRYVGKTVRVRVTAYVGDKVPDGFFLPGRFVMTCCEEDVKYFGVICKNTKNKTLKHRQWMILTAKVRHEYNQIYKGKGLVLEAVEIVDTVRPKEELVYFN